MHWDDDDWHAPHRIRYQAEALLAAGAEVCSVTQMLFYELATGKTWLYSYTARQLGWLAGGTLLYTRDFWRHSPFPDMQVASDTRFIANRRLDHAVVLPNYGFYVAMIHPGNTSPKRRQGAFWAPWPGDLQAIMGQDLSFYRSIFGSTDTATPQPSAELAPAGVRVLRPALAPERASSLAERTHTYSIIMVVHNARAMVQMAILRTLRHSAAHDARLVVVDNASGDGVSGWLELHAQGGDIDLIRSDTNIGHGPALELARRHTRSPYIVTLDSDAFPLSDEWLPRLRAGLNDQVKVVGIRHHRDYIHPACLLIERATLEAFGLTFLNEKGRPSQLDVAERISVELKQRGYQIAGLERTGGQRRGSVSEPVYLGSEYEGLVYHQWYTSRAAISGGRQVDDVPNEAIERSLQELFAQYHSEEREITVIIGIRAAPNEPQRQRNAIACLQALNFQDLPRWRYRIIVVEQGCAPQLEAVLAPLADRYIFAYNPGLYNRGWAFNIGAVQPGVEGSALCLIDADLLVPRDFLSCGLAAIRERGPAITPYTEVAYLDAAATERALRDWQPTSTTMPRPTEYGGRVFTNSKGGCIWVDAACYHKVGGHHEQFRGWGVEDREFCVRLNRVSRVERLPGRLLHLDHPRPAMDDTSGRRNQELFEQLAKEGLPRPPGPIGDPERYASERPAPTQTPNMQPGRRPWEHWHRWAPARIETIVARERALNRHKSARRQLADMLVRLGDSLLDLGCGPGALWGHLARYQPRFTWAGVDATAEMVAVARRLFPSVPVYNVDAAATTLNSNSFDIVLLRHVLEHLPSPLMAATLTEAMRLARRAVVLDFYVLPKDDGAAEVARVGAGFLETRWPRAEIEAVITAAGWHVFARFAITAEPNQPDGIWLLHPGAAPQPPAECVAPKVSIIMPTYRRCHTIARTIRCIQAQTYPNWELIVVDNAGDNQYVFADPRIHVYIHSEQVGSSYARNQGIGYATGDFVCFFDDDDDMFPTYLERFVDTFRAHANAKLVRCGMIVSDESINFTYATPECCLHRELVTPTWTNHGPGQDQRYFRAIVARHGWSEDYGDIVIIREALCRATADPQGGLRNGHF
jgi:glycosyltransferase involved in cell wall biosynthesis